MVAKNMQEVNSSATATAKMLTNVREAALTSHHVYRSHSKLRGPLDVNLRVAGETRVLIVYREAEIDQLRAAGLDLGFGSHFDKGWRVSYREAQGRLAFVGIRRADLPPPSPSEPPTTPPMQERVAPLLAVKAGDWCGTPTLALRVAGESRYAEAAGARQLAAIRDLGLLVDPTSRTWIEAPLGFAVRYEAKPAGPNLIYIALERTAAPAAAATPTAEAQQVAGLLPAWSRIISERLIEDYEATLPPRQVAFEDDAAWMATLLNGESVSLIIGGERPAPKSRRYARRQPRQVVGETTYKFSSEKFLDLPRQQRHEVMRALDGLLDNAVLPYVRSARGSDLNGFRDSMQRFTAMMMAVKGKVTQGRRAAEPPPANALAAANAKAASVYERQIAARLESEAADLQRLLKDWLKIEAAPTGNTYTVIEGEVTIQYRLEGFAERRSLRVSMTSLLSGHPVSRSILNAEEAETVIEALWLAYDKHIGRIEAQAAHRDERKERRVPPPASLRPHSLMM